MLSALVYSTFFPLFITKYIDTKMYSVFYGSAFLMSFIVALHLGKLADSRGIRKHFFALFSLLTALFCALLTLLTNMPWIALFVYSLMAISHQQALVFYNSMLLSFEKRGIASGLGVSVGYISSAFTLLFLAKEMHIPKVFLYASLLFVLLSTPALFFLKNPPYREKVSLREVFKDKKFMLAIISILSLTEVANTLIAMMGIYLKKVYGLEDENIYKVIGLSALGGVMGGVLFGKLSDKIQAHKLFPMGFFLWSFFLIILYFAPKGAILPVGFLAGLSLAHLWTTSRLFIMEKFPQTQVSVRLSFLSLTERIASTTGLFTWSLFLYITGDDYRLSALFMLVFPTMGYVVFRSVKFKGES
ncbi:MFS transporter [Hydrogenobacter hydrogenophilus]|uniref:MFS transporter n=1 Tax=Hydrogenobacter hydrogenophilus TaxID=35835 RepID=UPI001FEB2FB9|nr:MFS transporter [Hydrogenobacter hydrogenophilus]